MENKNSGIYLLEIRLKKAEDIKVGALGVCQFKPGYYYYIGSAQKNLKSRVERHFKAEKKFHWHIDYLLAKAEINNYYSFKAAKSFECKLFNYLNDIEKFKVPIDGFGSSDCKCISHLLYTEEKLDLKEYINKFCQRYLIKIGVNN